MSAASSQTPRLLDQVRGKIRLKHYSFRAEQTYVDWIKRFILHFGKRHPRAPGAADVEAFLTHRAAAGSGTRPGQATGTPLAGLISRPEGKITMSSQYGRGCVSGTSAASPHATARSPSPSCRSFIWQVLSSGGRH